MAEKLDHRSKKNTKRVSVKRGKERESSGRNSLLITSKNLYNTKLKK